MRILIVCGSGASSGFIAQRMRKAAKAKKIEARIDARSETELAEHLAGLDVLLVGPHLAYAYAQLSEQAQAHGVKTALIDQKIYGALDGAAAFELALSLAPQAR
ncbi:PTS sugar transporter subunit IIB [Streptomyces arenae]|uniref:PTS sugar transporter subunit IIB n=1 Tax=Streptomyces arenae TaxID=29301 RepID=UPI0026596ECB|nr:PTS sugar transporter subunit IIB [Streptomyces arenae]MCG7205115.1 PTS sugar transporter subunit IIB [Streptomyces arenae]